MKTSKRQTYWKKQGYTSKQIENHLRFERYKNKQARERKKKNNEKNIELIKKIKSDLIGKTFRDKTITKINETTDGLGFWWKCHRKFSDGSEGDFRYFTYFDDYSLKGFIEDIRYV